MRVLLARKEYVYYYLEYMHSNLKYLDVAENRIDEFLKVAKGLDLEVLAIGQFEPSSPSIKIFTIDEFAQLYFEIRDRNQIVDEEQELLDGYCKILEEFLSKN